MRAHLEHARARTRDVDLGQVEFRDEEMAETAMLFSGMELSGRQLKAQLIRTCTSDKHGHGHGHGTSQKSRCDIRDQIEGCCEM